MTYGEVRFCWQLDGQVQHMQCTLHVMFHKLPAVTQLLFLGSRGTHGMRFWLAALWDHSWCKSWLVLSQLQG